MRRQYATQTDAFPARLALASALAMILMILVGMRLFIRSVVAHDTTRAKAEQQYSIRQAVAPHRGKIYASDDSASLDTHTPTELTWKPLALSGRTYGLSVVPRNVKDIGAAATLLAPWADQSVSDLTALLTKNRDRLYLPPLKHGLSDEDKDKLTDLKLPGLLLIEEQSRFYPEGNLASQLLGFVNADARGTYGLEQFYDEDLRGSGGEVTGERDVRGRILGQQAYVPVRDGSSLVLTVDRNVQGFVESTLKKAIETYQAEAGTVVVMDVVTGGIVALANSPDYNPNDFRSVPQESQAVFANPGVSSVWEPGSIFKTIVMALALDKGLIEPDTEGVFSNSVTVQGFAIHTAEDKTFGKETMTQVLENSDNVAMVWIADKLGNQAMYDGLKKFGFGEPTGIDLPSEAKGSMLALSKWRDIHRATISFGQGISTTPIQLTNALATMANGGKFMQPHMVKEIIDAQGKVTTIEPKVIRTDVISPTTAAKITGMMVSVVEKGHGKRAKVPGYQIAGKTGTAQIPDPNGGYFEDQHIGGFGGFFPAENPRFAMVVKLDRPKTVEFAESSAAPTFGEIAKFMLNYYRIPPTESINGQ